MTAPPRRGAPGRPSPGARPRTARWRPRGPGADILCLKWLVPLFLPPSLPCFPNRSLWPTHSAAGPPRFPCRLPSWARGLLPAPLQCRGDGQSSSSIHWPPSCLWHRVSEDLASPLGQMQQGWSPSFLPCRCWTPWSPPEPPRAPWSPRGLAFRVSPPPEEPRCSWGEVPPPRRWWLPFAVRSGGVVTNQAGNSGLLTDGSPSGPAG